MLAGIGCVLLGVFALVFWCLAMFSSSVYGDLAREMLSGAFSLGRNTIAVIEPAVGAFFVFSGSGMILDSGSSGEGMLQNLCVIGTFVSMVVAVLGLIPVRLPGPMYPEWHEERRWLRAERADWEARYGAEQDDEEQWDPN